MAALATLGHFFLTLFTGLFVLTVLVFVHELGHYLAAKMFGMRVNAFAVFMGGVRQTDLTKWLKSPLAPSKYPWIAFVASFVLAVVGALAKSDLVYVAGLFGAGVVVPLWVMLRLERLYHTSEGKAVSIWFKTVLIAVIVLFVGTRFSGVDVVMGVGVLAAATLIALMVMYYLPIQMREQVDDQQGFGQIEVERGEDGSKDKLPVRFRPIWHVVSRDGTEFSLLLLPLGGFAQIAGMHPQPDGSETRIEGGFFSKSPWKRFVVLFAGPLFSVLFGVLLLFGLYTTVGKAVPDYSNLVGGVSEKSGAEAAGLQEGDRITAVNGSPIENFYGLMTHVRNQWKKVGDKNEPIPTQVTYVRDGETHTVSVVPTVDLEPMPLLDKDMNVLDTKAIQARLGIEFGFKYVPMSVGGALQAVVAEPVDMAKGVVGLFIRPVQASKQLTGPTTMAQVTSEAVKRGPADVIWFAAMLSLTLGVMNLLPIAPLDGGQIVVTIVEMVRGGRRLSINVQNMLTNVGIVLIVALMLTASAVDLGRKASVNSQEAQREAGK
ncbi:MAG TPA: site-2 protease family protein [Fimbriimonadaceae bacterium]|nr:site-2 protease family protein [Fimbriimonadaceae bacterium]